MDTELQQYEKKIKDYSIEELEEILISLNKDKFPEKYELVRNCLAEKIQGKFEAQKNPPSFKQPVSENKPPEAEIKKPKKSPEIQYDRPQKESSGVNLTLGLVTLLTSLLAVYILLLSIFNLPGKQLFVNFGKKLPGIASTSPQQQ